MEDNDIDVIIKLILGEKEYQNLIKEICKYFENNKHCKTNKDLENIFPITEACLIVIFLIGISKKTIKLDEYIVKLSSKNEKMIVETKKICKNFEKYIKGIEEFKINMLRKIT